MERKPNLEQWTADYRAATGNSGRVVAVWARQGPYGGIAIWCEVEEGGDTRHFSPYLDSSPGDGEHHVEPDWAGVYRDEGGRFCSPCGCDSCALDRHGSDEWVHWMEGATDWSGWEWNEDSPNCAY